MFWKQLAILLLLLSVPACWLWAQRAKYVDMPACYDLTIPQKTGNFVHAWGASAKQVYSQTQKITLTLYVFSPDMHLLARKNLQLGRIRSWNIDFEYSDSCYYASIYYRSDSIYHIMIKVNYDGTVTDANNHSWFARNMSIRQLNKFFAAERYKDYFYSIKIENNDTAFNVKTNDSISNDFISLDDDPIAGRQDLQTIVIKKVDTRTKVETAKTYASAVRNFWHPFIQATDTGIFAYSFGEYAGRKYRNIQNGSYMFIAKLDTGLHSNGNDFDMVRLGDLVKHKLFAPVNVFTIDKKKFIVNRGWDPDGSYYPNYNRVFSYYRSVAPLNPTNSFRITILDDHNLLLRDTILEDQPGDAPIRWENRFIDASNKKIDFFFVRQFRGSRNGMTHLYIGNEGKLNEENIIVDEHYEYNLRTGKKLTAGVLLVPYGKHGRTMGIMSMQYDTGDQ